MADERELDRIQRYVDKLTAGGVFHIREKRCQIDNDLTADGSLQVGGAGSIGGNLTVEGTLTSNGAAGFSSTVTAYNKLQVDVNLAGSAAVFTNSGDNTWSSAILARQSTAANSVGAGIVRIESAADDYASQIVINYVDAGATRFQLRGEGEIRTHDGLAVNTIATDPGTGLIVLGNYVGATVTRFGTSLPIYTTAAWPCVGFNAYLEGGVWKYGHGSSAHYASLAQCNTTSGGWEVHVTNTAGSAGGTITWAAGLRIGGAGTVEFPSIGTTASAANAFLDSTNSNRLLRSTSSLRYKRDISDARIDLDSIMRLRPITFKSAIVDDPVGDRVQIGLLAEEVAETLPEMVTCDDKGQPDWVQYPLLGVLAIAALQQLVSLLRSKGVLDDAHPS